MIKVLIFDLDDTLYKEIEYVRSGFKAVAIFLSKKYQAPYKEIYHEMLQILKKNGRNQVFDKILKKNKVYTKKNILKCLSVYRLHQPKINLDNEAEKCFNRFANTPKYIVTDGNKIVQRKKIQALRISKYIKHTYITHQYGKINAKPSSYCFKKISQLEKTPPKDIIYIGDDPQKDFVNIKKLGYKTIRILQGRCKDIKMSKKYEADITITSLNEVTNKLLNTL